MKLLDRALQHWRIHKAAKHLKMMTGPIRVLDIGAYDGTMFNAIGEKLTWGVGIDPLLIKGHRTERYELIAGYFPGALVGEMKNSFDLITMLAVIEHFPNDLLTKLSGYCFDYLKPDGKVIITVPSPMVDKIINILLFFRLIDGIDHEDHHGYDVGQTEHFFVMMG